MWRVGGWAPLPPRPRSPPLPEGPRPTLVSSPPVSTARIRVILEPRGRAPVGLSELEAWGPAAFPLAEPTAPPRDLAFNAGAAEYPRASASFTSEVDRVEQVT